MIDMTANMQSFHPWRKKRCIFSFCVTRLAWVSSQQVPADWRSFKWVNKFNQLLQFCIFRCEQTSLDIQHDHKALCSITTTLQSKSTDKYVKLNLLLSEESPTPHYVCFRIWIFSTYRKHGKNNGFLTCKWHRMRWEKGLFSQQYLNLTKFLVARQFVHLPVIRYVGVQVIIALKLTHRVTSPNNMAGNFGCFARWDKLCLHSISGANLESVCNCVLCFYWKSLHLLVRGGAVSGDGF